MTQSKRAAERAREKVVLAAMRLYWRWTNPAVYDVSEVSAKLIAACHDLARQRKGRKRD